MEKKMEKLWYCGTCNKVLTENVFNIFPDDNMNTRCQSCSSICTPYVPPSPTQPIVEVGKKVPTKTEVEKDELKMETARNVHEGAEYIFFCLTDLLPERDRLIELQKTGANYKDCPDYLEVSKRLRDKFAACFSGLKAIEKETKTKSGEEGEEVCRFQEGCHIVGEHVDSHTRSCTPAPEQESGDTVEHLVHNFGLQFESCGMDGLDEKEMIERLSKLILTREQSAYERGKKEIMQSDFVGKVREEAFERGKSKERERILEEVNKKEDSLYGSDRAYCIDGMALARYIISLK